MLPRVTDLFDLSFVTNTIVGLFQSNLVSAGLLVFLLAMTLSVMNLRLALLVLFMVFLNWLLPSYVSSICDLTPRDVHPLLSLAEASCLATPFEKERDASSNYRSNSRVSTLLQEHLPAWTLTTPSGGFFLCVRLPFGDVSEFAQLALRFAVAVILGAVMSVDDSQQQNLRLPYLLTPDVLEKGIRRLVQVWNIYGQLARERHGLLNEIV